MELSYNLSVSHSQAPKIKVSTISVCFWHLASWFLSMKLLGDECVDDVFCLYFCKLFEVRDCVFCHFPLSMPVSGTEDYFLNELMN